jgi:Cellulase (glycosyl hydrolase family 5)
VRGRAAAVLAVVLLVAAALSGAAGARTPLKMIWGPATMPNGASAFPTYRSLGVQMFQIQLAWSSVAPTRPADPGDPADPAYRWPASLDAIVAAARANGIGVCILVHGSPPWANGGRDPSWAPRRAGDFARFLAAASRRYPSVRHWMIWGEPTRAGNFRPMPAHSPAGPRRYAKMLDAAYGALKRVSGRNVVIGGDTWTLGLVTPPEFLRWMRLPNGRPPRLDMWGHNPFSVRFPDLAADPYYPGLRDISDIDTLEHEIHRVYHRTKPLWLSEWTVSSDRGNRAFNFSVSRSAQARWVTAAFRLVDRTSYVAGLGWYDLLDESPGVSGHLTTGLMTYEARPKPAFFAYQHAR